MPVRIATAAAAWVLVSSFPQGQLYRSEREGSDVVALRAEGRLKAPAWAVREVLASGWKYDGVSPYLAERKVLSGIECRGGARDLPGCRAVWAYERYEPPVVGARDYVFRMEIVADDLATGGPFELAWTLDESRGGPPDGTTHMRANEGAWRVTPDGAETRFAYRIVIDPGGGIPTWVVNMANKSSVPKVIAAVEEEAAKLAAERGAERGGPVAAPPTASKSP
jgi:hypothetical protein